MTYAQADFPEESQITEQVLFLLASTDFATLLLENYRNQASITLYILIHEATLDDCVNL